MRTHVRRSSGAVASAATTLRKVVLAGSFSMACHAGVGGANGPLGPAAAPVINPGTSASDAPITATVSCPTVGSLPYLTTDGSTPTTGSTQAASATFTQTGTLQAICAGGGYSASSVASATYTVAGVPVAAAPRITPGTSRSPTPVTATVSCSSTGTVPYLTTDGSTPTTASTQASSATFTKTGTLEAICAGGGYSASSVALATYTIGDAILTIPSEHPRLWFTPERLATVRAWWQTHPFTPAAGNYLEYAFAHVASGGSISCRPALDYALTHPVSVGPVGSDSSRWYGETMIVVFDWCYDQLTTTEKADLVANINSWMTPLMRQGWGGPTMPVNNYFYGNMRNELEWAIASYGDNTTQADVYLDDVFNVRLPALVSYHANYPGGVFEEGQQYGRYAAHYPVIPFVTSMLEGRDVYGSSRHFLEAVFYLIYETTPAPTNTRSDGGSRYELFPFSDDEKFQYGGSAASRSSDSRPGTYFGDFMQTMAILYPSRNVGRYAQQWVNTIGAGSFVSYWIQPFAGSAQPLAFSGLPLDYYAPGMQFLYVRKAWDTSSAVAHVQIGKTHVRGAHQHADVGTWQIWRGGRWLSRESTGYSDTLAGFNGAGTIETADTMAHNAILVNPDDQGCSAGSSCWSGGGFYAYGDHNDWPRVARLESQPGYAYLAADVSATYRNSNESPNHPERDNPAVKTIVREFVFVRDLEALVIFDRIEANPVGSVAAASIKRAFVAHCETTWALSGGAATCTNGPQALRLTTLLPASPGKQVTGEGNAVVGQSRLEVTDSGSAQSYFLHVADATARLSPTVTENGTSLTVTLDGTHAITFLKGMSSSGGSITIGGLTTPFRSDVQPVTVTDAGPAWK